MKGNEINYEKQRNGNRFDEVVAQYIQRSFTTDELPRFSSTLGKEVKGNRMGDKKEKGKERFKM